ncbi:type II secretion system F family protein [Nocardia sp. NPDC049220]|uniref:type II secretion system F family protein n=1 Tax=Nocardia sp. NPDC049220 TaxID=3155273 RepID=UPI0033F77AF4
MSAAMVCLALSVLALPASPARRRFTRMSTAREQHRKPLQRMVFATVPPVGAAAVIAFGLGPVLAAGLIAGTVGLRVHRAARDRRAHTECGFLLDALEAMIGELRVGAHPSAAAEMAARESQGDSARMFAVCAARSKLGGSAADGLRQSNSTVAVELSRIADAWQVAERHGLALAELLSAARTDLAGRIRFRGRTTAALAGARATAAVLAGLPCLGIALGELMDASPLRVLFASPAGTVLLPLGAGLACAGLLWTDMITRKVLV